MVLYKKSVKPLGGRADSVEDVVQWGGAWSLFGRLHFLFIFFLQCRWNASNELPAPATMPSMP